MLHAFQVTPPVVEVFMTSAMVPGGQVSEYYKMFILLNVPLASSWKDMHRFMQSYVPLFTLCKTMSVEAPGAAPSTGEER